MKQRSTLWLLLAHELRSIARDHRTILLAVLLPLVVMPVMLLGQQQVKKQKDADAEVRTYAYAVVGDTKWVATLLSDDSKGPPLEAEQSTDPAAALADGKLAAVVHTDTDDDGLPRIDIHFRADKESSRKAKEAIEDRLLRARDAARADVLVAAGSSVPMGDAIAVAMRDVAPEGQTSGAKLGVFLTAFLVFLIVLGGQVAAADLLAGEKERGTLETLLTTAARREDIVLSKLLTILVVALVVVLINLGNLMIYVTLGLIPGLEDLAASLPPMAIAALTVLMIPVTLVISALLLLLSGYARSYKEAQLFGFPVQLGLLLPAMAPALPGLPLRSAIVVAPVANAAVAVREVMAGRFDWLMIVAVVVVNVAVGLWIARATTRALREERLISAATQESAELEGGERAFERNIWRWVLVAWALFYLFALNVSDVDLRVQLFFNLVVLFFGVSVVIVRHYRLDVRKVWSLRAPPRMAWVAVAIGVPSGLMVAQGVSAISNLIFPVPEAVLRSFSGSILPEDIPAWQLLPLLSLLPGFCEEIFFRGTLLHALRKRLSPVVLCLVVGLVFGLFHGALFRILPTGSLGVLFTATVLLTRSIYPAMVWHALNNLLGVSIGLAGYDTATLPVWAPVAALPVLGLAFALLWRHRVRGPPD